MGEPILGPLPARRQRCVAGRCLRMTIPTWPWCEEHRPRFDREPVRLPPAKDPRDRVREAVRRWPDWSDEALSVAALAPMWMVFRERIALGVHRDRL